MSCSQIVVFTVLVYALNCPIFCSDMVYVKILKTVARERVAIGNIKSLLISLNTTHGNHNNPEYKRNHI